jgi:hypothetical protein
MFINIKFNGKVNLYMTNKTKNLACFKAHSNKKKCCEISKCRYWHNIESSYNCIINKVNEEKDLTLQEIGDLFNITRMRVCQIEKQTLSKIKKQNKSTNFLTK